MLHPPGAQHHNLVGKGHRLDLIVGDVDHGRPNFLVKPGDFDPHVHPQFRIKVGERFIKQKHLRPPHNRATNRNSLTLPAR